MAHALAISLTSRKFRVPTSVGLFLLDNGQTKVATLNIGLADMFEKLKPPPLSHMASAGLSM
jgi:hypothetical protein